MLNYSAGFGYASRAHGSVMKGPLALRGFGYRRGTKRSSARLFVCLFLGLRVHREAGGDAGEASHLRPHGSPTRQVPLRLCTEPVRWRFGLSWEVGFVLGDGLEIPRNNFSANKWPSRRCSGVCVCVCVTHTSSAFPPLLFPSRWMMSLNCR